MADLRTAEVAERLGMSVREVLTLIDDGALRRGKDERGRLVVPADSVDEFLRSRSAPSG